MSLNTIHLAGHRLEPTETDVKEEHGPVGDSQLGVDGDAVRAQLSRVLENHLFSHSKRYPAFLRYIVEKTLKGQTCELKERVVGVEVFDRPADYDPNANAIVRVTAAEIRKRLAQYYIEPCHQNELRIEVPIGTYVPIFRPPVSAGPAAYSPVTVAAAAPANSGEAPDQSGDLFGRALFYGRLKHPAIWGALACMVVLLFAFFYRATKADSVVDQFWDQMIASRNPIALCVAKGIGNGKNIGIVMSDVGTISVIRDTLESHRKEFRLVNATSADLQETRDDPVVFVGPLYTPWVQEVTAPLRYRFENSPDGKERWIADTRTDSEQKWIDPSGPERPLSHAIIARFVDRALDRPIVIASGLSPQATVAAGEILTNPQYMRILLQNAPDNWEDMNLEAVIETHIVDGKAGPPQVDAVYFWR